MTLEGNKHGSAIAQRNPYHGSIVARSAIAWVSPTRIPRQTNRKRNAGGFTIIELMMVTGIVGILSSIALNSYAQYLYRAEITQVVVDMGGISRRIDMFRTETGLLPASFDQIGVVVLDPWGNPYQYLPVAASMSSGSNGNSGNGNGNSGNGSGNGNGNGNGNQNGNSTGGSNGGSNGGSSGVGQLRKDKNLVPINSDYDPYSMGKDGRSVSPLTAQPSRDDIIRANNGAYIGLAEKY